MYVAVLLWSWRKVSLEGIRSDARRRQLCGFLALTLATSSALLFIAMQVYAAAIGGFTKLTPLLAIVIVGGWILSVIAFFLAIVSHGWRRVATLVLSSVVVLFWSAMWGISGIMF